MKFIHVMKGKKNTALRPHFLPREEIYQQDAFSASIAETAEASVDCHNSFFVITSANAVEIAAVTAIVARRIISPLIFVQPLSILVNACIIVAGGAARKTKKISILRRLRRITDVCKTARIQGPRHGLMARALNLWKF